MTKEQVERVVKNLTVAKTYYQSLWFKGFRQRETNNRKALLIERCRDAYGTLNNGNLSQAQWMHLNTILNESKDLLK